MELVVCLVIPVSTHVPPLRVRLSAACTSSPEIRDGETMTLSAMTPRVRSRTRSAASSVVETLCVAPNPSADFCLNSTGSTAMICAAPLMRAPWIAPVPMPPTPMTTTVSPVLHLGTVLRGTVAGGNPARQQCHRQQRQMGIDLDDRIR